MRLRAPHPQQPAAQALEESARSSHEHTVPIFVIQDHTADQPQPHSPAPGLVLTLQPFSPTPRPALCPWRHVPTPGPAGGTVKVAVWRWPRPSPGGNAAAALSQKLRKGELKGWGWPAPFFLPARQTPAPSLRCVPAAAPTRGAGPLGAGVGQQAQHSTALSIWGSWEGSVSVGHPGWAAS